MTRSSHLEVTETPWTLANVVRTHARVRGGRPMITYGQRTITYAEMDARSSRVARALAAEGVAAQDRVAFLDKNGPEYFEVLFGGGKITEWPARRVPSRGCRASGRRRRMRRRDTIAPSASVAARG